MTNRDRREFLGVAGAAVLAGAMPGCAQQPVSATGAAKAPGSVPGYQSASELADAIKARKVSSVEVVDHVIARIERFDPALNAVVVRDFEAAREAAKAADKASQGGDRRPLLGVPIVVKESFNVAGLATTWGIPQQKNFIAKEDAVVIARLKNAGAIILGKTNVPFMLTDWQSYNDVYGQTNNPWDVTRSPGGSSGGSAAGLAAGFVPLELGSDIGGSLRAPAHFCGVFAHKPTQALVPSRGHNPPRVPSLPFDVDLAAVGPMARSAGDLSLALDVLAGPDEPLATAYRLELPKPRHENLKDFRVLLLDAHPLFPTGAAVRGTLERFADRLTKAGVAVTRSSPLMPDLGFMARTYLSLLYSIFGADVPAETYAQVRNVAAAIAEGADDLDARTTRGLVLSHRDWIVADRMRTGLAARLRTLFRQFDVIVCPVLSTPAFPHDHSDFRSRRLDVDGVSQRYAHQIVWAGVATLTGQPATALPLERTDQGLPVGAQIVGPYLEDRTPLAFAALAEREFGGFVPPPDFAG
jgi:amidase